MAKREVIPAKPEPRQRTLFDTTTRPNMVVDREGIDAKYQALLDAGQPTYRTNGYTLTCLVCNRSTSNSIYVKSKFCFDCILTHGVPLDQQ